MTWYFSKALGVIGLLIGLLRVAVPVVLGDGGAGMLGAVGGGILFTIGGLLAGVVIDVIVAAKRRTHRREPGRGGMPRKR